MYLAGEGYIVQSKDKLITLCGHTNMHSSAYLIPTEYVTGGKNYPLVCTTEQTARNAVLAMMDLTPERYEQVLDILKLKGMLQQTNTFSKEADRKMFADYFQVHRISWSLATEDD